MLILTKIDISKNIQNLNKSIIIVGTSILYTLIICIFLYLAIFTFLSMRAWRFNNFRTVPRNYPQSSNVNAILERIT